MRSVKRVLCFNEMGCQQNKRSCKLQTTGIIFSERRRLQLRSWDDREKQMAPPLPRRPRLRFSAEVALLEATSRGDAAEG